MPTKDIVFPTTLNVAQFWMGIINPHEARGLLEYLAFQKSLEFLVWFCLGSPSPSPQYDESLNKKKQTVARFL